MARPLLVLLLSVTLLSCTEKNIIMPVDGSVSGYLRPAVGGAMIRTADSSVTTISLDDGYFLLQPVSPGTHDIIVDADGFSRRVLRQLIVHTGRTTTLEPVTLSRMPYPVFDVDPDDGTILVSTGTTIYVSCDERLDFASLNESAAISPPIAGAWFEHGLPYPGGAPLVFYYSFSRGEYYDLNTAYTLTIAGDTKTLAGKTLGRPIEIHFTTAPLTAGITVKAQNGSPPIVNVLTPDLRVYFNAEVHIDSLRKAVLIDPPIEGVWVPATGDSLSGAFGFTMPSGSYLRPSTNYAVLIRDDIALSGPHRLGESFLKIFVTNGFAIENPRAGSSSLIAADGPASIQFNIPADTAATTAAITIKRSDGTYLPFISSWEDELREVKFTPTDGWEGGVTYKVTVSTNAKSLEGGRLAYLYEFYVQPRD